MAGTSELDITQQFVCVTGQKPYLGPPETRTSVRSVKAACISMAALARHLEPFPARRFPKGAGLHSLRHYFAARLIHQDASVKRVQFALGHAKPTITLNTT